MRIRSAALHVFSIVGISSWLISFPAFAGLPTDQTKATVDRVVSIISNPALQSKKDERREQLRAVIYPRFDFIEMAKRSLGPHWTRRTPQEQQEFVKVFTGLLETSYVDKIESFNGEKVAYTREQVDGDNAEVFTKVVTKKGEEFSINYKLHLVNGEWKVYDVVVEDISLVNNYRSQFNRVLANASFDELLRKLQQKAPDIKTPGVRKG
jgi:phospholipid transport system substrate-binding protein